MSDLNSNAIRAGAAAVREAFNSQASGFRPEHFEPRSLSGTSNSQLKQKSSSVFVGNAEWASQSTRAILDALHSRTAKEAASCDEAKFELSYLRSAGSMMQDGNDADLFESENVRGSWPRGSSRNFIVECKHCHRAVLGTRFIDHLRQCKKYPRTNSIGLTRTDAELPLVVSPYVWTSARNSTTPTPGAETSVDDASVSIVTLPYMAGITFGAGSVRRRGFQWQKRLSPLAPLRKARGGGLYRHQKMELVPFKSSTPPKKKQGTPEKRALTAASSVGLGSVIEKEDSLEFAGSNWGLSAQWAKLIQCCRPIVVPRSELRKNAYVRETPLSLFVKGPNKFLLAETPNSKMVPQNSSTRIPKALSRPLPSLPGALLHIRGKYFKNLQGTDLGTLDITSTSIPKAIYMYHGQSFFANPGQFYSDQRCPHEVVLPTSVVDTTAVAVRNGNHAQLGAHQAQLLAAHRSTTNGPVATPSQEPPTKKQRVSKPRSGGTSSAGGVPPKQPLGVQRQHRPIPTGSTVANPKMNAARLQQHYARRPAMGISGNPGVPAAMKRSQPQSGLQKQHYRNQTAIPPSAISPNALNSVGMSSNNVTPSAGMNVGALSNTRNRGNVLPSHPNTQAQKMMHHGTGNVINAFHQQVAGTSVPNRVDPSLNNPAAAGFQALIRQAGSSASTAVTQPSINFNQQLASMISRGSAQKKQNPARGLSGTAAAARIQHQPNLNLLEIDQRTQAQAQAQAQARVHVQAQQVQVQVAAQAQAQAQAQARARAARVAQQKAQAHQVQMAAAHQVQALRNYPHGSQAAALRRFHPGAQVRPSSAIPSSGQTSSALSGRSGVASNTGSSAGGSGTGQMFRGQQMFNSGFPVQVPQSHERSPATQSMSLQQSPNATNIAYMQQLMQGTAGTSISGGHGGRPPSMSNLALPNGHYGNVPNFFPSTADTNGGAIGQQNMNAINAARMAGLSGAGMIPSDPLLSQFHPTAAANLMHGMQNNGAGGPMMTAPNPVSNQSQSASQALSAIDKALSLNGKD